MKRFSELKVGDKITARYYENVVVRLKRPGEAAVDVDSAQLNRNEEGRPAVTAPTQRTITVTVTAMDPKTSTVTVNGPNGYVYSRKVADKKAFNQLKVGDKLDMTWTEALLISSSPRSSRSTRGDASCLRSPDRRGELLRAKALNGHTAHIREQGSPLAKEGISSKRSQTAAAAEERISRRLT